MGQITIPIGFIGIPNMRSDKWYTLLPKPVQVGNLAAMFDKKVKKKADEDVTKAKLLVHAHQALDLEWDDFFKAKKPHKFSETKFTSMTYCAHCCGMMWAGSNEMQCKECRLNCHSRCSKFIAKHCGDMSLIRLRIKLLVYDRFDVAIHTNLSIGDTCFGIGKVRKVHQHFDAGRLLALYAAGIGNTRKRRGRTKSDPHLRTAWPGDRVFEIQYSKRSFDGT